MITLEQGGSKKIRWDIIVINEPMKKIVVVIRVISCWNPFVAAYQLFRPRRHFDPAHRAARLFPAIAADKLT